MENYCNYCGGLSWTVLKYGRKIHKQNCPARIEEFHQGNPPPIPELAILSKLEEPYVVAKLEIPAEAVSKLGSVVAPSEEVKQSFNDKGEIILPDLPQDQKDKLIEQAIETASYVLLFSMKCVKVENYITGTIENNGHTYELSFKKVTPK